MIIPNKYYLHDIDINNNNYQIFLVSITWERCWRHRFLGNVFLRVGTGLETFKSWSIKRGRILNGKHFLLRHDVRAQVTVFALLPVVLAGPT